MPALLVLASASPRRRALLTQLGLDFEVVPSTVPEAPAPGEAAAAFASRIAREKAQEVATRRPTGWVLAADTVVECGGEILGKPENRADGRRMLRRLSAQTHRVLTAVTLLAPGGGLAEEVVVESAVTFLTLSDGEIEAYLDSAEPYDKAGAYAVQGQAARFVVNVAGSYANVVGLPLDEVRVMLQRHGLLTTVSGVAAPAP